MESRVSANRGGAHRRDSTARKSKSSDGSERSSRIVRETLAAYAQRGIFRAYGEGPSPGGRRVFSFRWHTDVPFHVVYDAPRHQLIFCDLLPGIDGRSHMYRHLKEFLHSRTSAAMPAHRRIDPRRATVTLKHRAHTVSVVVSLKASHLEYGVRKAVNLIHELFVVFLRDPLYFPYMVEHFDLDPEM